MKSLRRTHWTPRLAAVGLILLAGLALACSDRDSAQGRSSQGAPADLESILQIDEHLVRVERVAAFLQRAPYDQLPEIRHTFEHAVLDRGDLEYALFIEWWGRYAPQEALAYTVRGKLRGMHPRLRGTAVRVWARQDPQGALATGWLRDPTQHDGTLDRVSLDALVVGWWESGEPGLEEFLNGLEIISDKTRGMRTYARRRIFRDGASETLEWATSGASPFDAEHNRLMIAGVLSLLAHEDPRLAVEWLPKLDEVGIDIRSFAMRIASSWSHHEPKEAMAWSLELTTERDRTSAVRVTAEEWHRENPAEFLAWLDEQPEEELYDAVRQAATKQYVWDNLPDGVDWEKTLDRALQMSQPVKEQVLVLWALQVWHDRDPQAAKAWINARPDLLSPARLARVDLISKFDREHIDRLLKEREQATQMPPIVVHDEYPRPF